MSIKLPAIGGGNWNPSQAEFLTNKKFGSGADFSTFEADGTLVASGEAQTWEDVNIGGISLTGAGGAAPDIVTVGGIRFYAFDGTNVLEELCGVIELPHAYAEGQDIFAHVHWLNATTAAGVVRWKLDYAWVNVGGQFTATTAATLDQSVNTAGSNYSHVVSTQINGAGKLISSHFIFRLFRDPSDGVDTYTGDAYLVAFGLHVPVNTLGSRQVGTK